MTSTPAPTRHHVLCDRITAILRRRCLVTAAQAAKATGASQGRVYKALATLVYSGAVVRHDPPPGGRGRRRTGTGSGRKAAFYELKDGGTAA